jgi:hemolysin-activating ACP:hemolysin acyltransferase
MQPALESHPHERAPARTVPELRVVRPDNPFLALGLAVSHLMTKPAFAGLRFGEWSRILVGQINRKHFCFVIDSKNQVHGLLGWALTSKVNAEAWVEGRRGVSFQGDEGDCIIFNAWASSSSKARRLLMIEARKAMAGKTMAYFKRQYPDGSTRPSRLAVNEFVDQHIERGG